MHKLFGKWHDTAALLLAFVTSNAWAAPTVTDLALVSEKRITRTVYEYTYKATIKNDSIVRANVVAMLTGVGPGTSIVEAEVAAGDLAADATVTPADTFKIRHDRTIAFDRSKMVWVMSSVEIINGIVVPPEPDVAVNNSTLEGVDVDGNGIRDDIDRLLASRFGADPAYFEVVQNFARTERASILDPSPYRVSQHIDTFRCITDSGKLDDLNEITLAAINTPTRRAAYGAAFAGAWVSSEGCNQ